MKSFVFGSLTGIAAFIACLIGPPNWRNIQFEPVFFMLSRYEPPLQINRYDPCPDVIDFKIRP